MNKFKDPRNNWRTRSLFADVQSNNGYEHAEGVAIYWLYEKGDERPFLHDEYIKCNDLTGIKFAKKWLGGYEHFKVLLETQFFSKEYNRWKEELQTIKQAEALFNIETIASDEEHSQRFQANKYLANKEYEGQTASKRGRPSTDEITGELKKQAKVVSETRQDLERMTGLTVIQGGKN